MANNEFVLNGGDPESSQGLQEASSGFDLSRLRLSQDFEKDAGVKKALLTVPVHKPGPQVYFRIHAHEDYRMRVALIELKEDRDTYIVAGNLQGTLAGEAVAKMLYTAISRQGDVFLWPIRLPDRNGRLDEWSRSATKAAVIAQDEWIRLVSNLNLGAYEPWMPYERFPEPVWPDVPFERLLQIAFQGRIIDTEDHPVIRRLRGAQ